MPIPSKATHNYFNNLKGAPFWCRCGEYQLKGSSFCSKCKRKNIWKAFSGRAKANELMTAPVIKDYKRAKWRTLSAQEIDSIKFLYKKGISAHKIAKRFNCSPSTVYVYTRNVRRELPKLPTSDTLEVERPTAQKPTETLKESGIKALVREELRALIREAIKEELGAL